MSDLTAQHWSERALAILRTKEQSCAESDLFCVGYLIPQVELIEVEHVDQKASPDWWQSRFIDFVRRNMVTDKMQEEDVATIERLMASL